MFNLLSPWNHWIKNVTGTIVQHKLVADALLLSGKKSIGKSIVAFHLINYIFSQNEEHKYKQK